MIISMIAAIGSNRELGLDNKMLWHIPDDFKHFKNVTSGHHILMGRKTYESIGRPLPNRKTLIITHQKNYQPHPDVEVFNDFEEALNFAKNNGEKELFICGGGEIYKKLLPIAKKLYISKVKYSGKADTYFPDYTEQNWKLTSKEEFLYNSADKIDWELNILTK